MGITVIYASATALQLAIALVAALALHQKCIRFKSLWRGVMLMPYAMPPVVTGAIWIYLLEPYDGMVWHYLAPILGWDRTEPVAWASDPFGANCIIVLVSSWTFWPFMFVIILASLQSIPPSYYELAEVYGANLWQRFWVVTLPHIRSAMLAAVIIRIVWNLAKIEQPRQLTAGGPANWTNLLSILTYDRASAGDFGKAFAVGIVLLVVMLVLLAPFLRSFWRQMRLAQKG